MKSARFDETILRAREGKAPFVEDLFTVVFYGLKTFWLQNCAILRNALPMVLVAIT